MLTNIYYPKSVGGMGDAAGKITHWPITIANSCDEGLMFNVTNVFSTPRPIRQLERFKRISLKPGESKEVEFTLEPILVM